MTDAPRTARARARVEITEEILASARRQLATVGPGGLSLRAVARDVGMVSSAVYRYVASRDDLLTALIVRAYDELGEHVETADAAVADRQDHRARWTASCRALRGWALAHPHDHALVYGSPVIGYAAPQDTVRAAVRVVLVLATIAVEANAGRPGRRPVPDALAGTAAAARDALVERGLDAGDVADDVVTAVLLAWTTVVGTVSFELAGHYVGSVQDADAWFDDVVDRLADAALGPA
ncbi:TetR/AcrR family transcriptional regulator [Solicola sp. PLA-1-18]|uniref:TetR/AcrR family transcriptional regulator n=1 Tax=Solicola sp. PLA-1-18 TaxID=3380532 RepID=UPI003B7BCF5F